MVYTLGVARGWTPLASSYSSSYCFRIEVSLF